MDFAKYVVGFMAAVSTVAVLVSVGARSGPRKPGWRHLTPSPLHWTAVGLGGGLTLLMTYVRLFVGSSRSDAEFQMMILTGLILAFGVMTAGAAFQIVELKRQSIRWRGTTIVHAAGKGEARHELRQIMQAHKQPLGRIELTFADGTRLPIDPYANTATELFERIEELRAAVLRVECSN